MNPAPRGETSSSSEDEEAEEDLLPEEEEVMAAEAVVPPWPRVWAAGRAEASVGAVGVGGENGGRGVIGGGGRGKGKSEGIGLTASGHVGAGEAGVDDVRRGIDEGYVRTLVQRRVLRAGVVDDLHRNDVADGTTEGG